MDVDGDGEIDFNEFATLLLDPCGENLMRAVARKILDCHELFALFDFDGGGTIDMDELRHVMTCLGHHPSDALLDAVINFSDEENLGEDTSVGQLDFAEFVSLFACGTDGGVSPLAYYCLNRQVVEFKESFSMFDLDTEGRIDLPSFEKGVACIMGDKMPKDLPAAIMKHLQELRQVTLKTRPFVSCSRRSVCMRRPCISLNLRPESFQFRSFTCLRLKESRLLKRARLLAPKHRCHQCHLLLLLPSPRGSAFLSRRHRLTLLLQGHGCYLQPSEHNHHRRRSPGRSRNTHVWTWTI